MRAAVFRAAAPEGIAFEEVPTPEPGPGQVRLRVLATALNHIDPMARSARGAQGEAFWSGADIVGVVDALGPGVHGLEPGQRLVANPSLYAGPEPERLTQEILGYDRPGGLAEFVVVDAADALPVPEGLADELVAAAPLAYQTAWRGLVSRGRLRADETLLVTGASGGVGVAAIQIARLLGARVLALTSAAKRARIEALGVQAVFDRDAGEPWPAIRAAVGGVDLAFDGVGAPYWPGLISVLRDGGRLVSYGRTAGRDAALDVREIFWRQLSVLGTSMATRAEFAAVMGEVFAGRLVPLVDSVFPFSETRAAFGRLAAAAQVGKVVVRIAA